VPLNPAGFSALVPWGIDPPKHPAKQVPDPKGRVSAKCPTVFRKEPVTKQKPKQAMRGQAHESLLGGRREEASPVAE